MSSNDFESSYRGTPPWDIGRPQLEIVRLAERGDIHGKVLDVGCGTGENSIYLSRSGYQVVGIDSSPTAIRKATAKTESGRKINATFFVGDALNLHKLNQVFDTIIDSGLFHALSDEERTRFTKSLLSAMSRGGRYFMLCFSEKEPKNWGGPRRISKDEIYETFQNGWKINHIKEGLFETNFHEIGGKAWISSITKI